MATRYHVKITNKVNGKIVKTALSSESHKFMSSAVHELIILQNMFPQFEYEIIPAAEEFEYKAIPVVQGGK